MEESLVKYLRKQLQRSYDKTFLETVVGPDVFGEGNFIIYVDKEGEWEIQPIKGWKAAELRGIITNKGDE